MCIKIHTTIRIIMRIVILTLIIKRITMYKIYYNSSNDSFEYMKNSSIETVNFPARVEAISLLTDEQVRTTVSRELAEDLMVDEWDLYITD